MTQALPPEPPALVLPSDDTPMLEAAQMYAAAEFAPVPLWGLRPDGSCSCPAGDDCPPRNRGKHPMGAGWQKRATTDRDKIWERFQGHRGNIGVYLAIGDYVLIDADGELGLETARTWELPETLTQQSGSGVGAHYIYRLAPHQNGAAVTDRRVAPGLDVKVRGQFVAAPSRHASGGQYRWTGIRAVATLPDWLYDRIRKEPSRPALETEPPTDPSTLRKRAEAYLAKIPPAIAGSEGHKQCFAFARALAGFLDRGLPESECLALLERYSATCQPPWSKSELAHKWKDAQAAHTKPALVDRPRLRIVRPEDEPPLPSDPGGLVQTNSADWRGELLWTESKTGRPKLVSDLTNVIRILQLDPDWRGKIGFDAFRSRIAVAPDAPWNGYSRPSEATRFWTDEDTTRLNAWLRERFQKFAFAPSISDCERAVAVVSRTHDFNPVRDYLQSVTWDGSARLATWLHDYLGAEAGPYAEKVGAWWLISAVARVFKPGCKVDTVPILEGPQGMRKSSALAVLAGPEYFNDTPIDLDSKDAYSAIQGCWFVELAELDSLMRVEASRAKAFFSSGKDRFRRAYARHEQDELRQCIFVGTVNLGEYLNDPTGARRFWPIRCTVIRLAELEAIRDQLWAEAVVRYEDKAVWYPTSPEDEALLDEPQATRTRRDAWESLIRSYLSKTTTGQVTTGDVLGGALNLEPRDWTPATQTRVGILMISRFGWEKRRVSGPDGSRVWVYERPSTGVGQ
jgi:hypothetical protein